MQSLNMRPTGIEIVGDVPWGSHFCQFYEDRNDLIDLLVPYFKSGLQRNEFCMWITSGPLQADEAEKALAGGVDDFEAACNRGQFEILDYRQWYTKDGKFDAGRVLQGWVDKLEGARQQGFDGLRLCGDTSWLDASEWQEFAQYEAIVDRVLADRKMLALCSYSLNKCDASGIMDVVGNHAFALIRKRGTWQVIENAGRKKAERSFHEGERRYRTLFDRMTEGFALHEIVCDKNGEPCDYRFLEVNPAFERITGLKREDLVGRLKSEVVPDDGSGWVDIYGRVALQGEPAHFNTLSTTQDKYHEVFAYSPAPAQFAVHVKDITDRKNAHDTMAWLATFPEFNPFPIVEAGLDGSIHFANPAASRLFPDLRDKQVAHSWLGDWGAVVRSCEAEEALSRELAIGEHWYQQMIYYVRQTQRIRIYGMDVTDRRRREDELRKVNRTLTALRHSSQAMLRAHTESEYLQEVCKIVAEDCGHALVWIGFAEDDRAKTVRPVASAGFEEGYLETLKITWDDTERGRGPTGTAIREGKASTCKNILTDPRFAPWREQALKRGYASSAVLPLFSNDRVLGAISIYAREPEAFSNEEMALLQSLADDLAYGITAMRMREANMRSEEALRQSEERYRSLVELSPEAILVDRDSRISFVNPAAIQLFGATSAEQVIGKSPFDLFHPDYHADIRARIEKLMDGIAVEFIEQKIVRIDGTVRDVEVAATPVTDSEGVSIQVILRDITQRKQAEGQLRKTAAELARSNKDLEHFAYVASHDLQEPLRTVRSFAQMLHQRYRGKMEADADDFIDFIVDGAGRMQTLITDLLAYSRVSSVSHTLKPTDSETSLELALGSLRRTVSASGATITHDPLPAVVADQGQLAQLFQNLIGNGVKFCRKGIPPHVHVSAREEESRWLFSVRDNGIGIEAQYYEKVFAIFERLHGIREYSGTGVGLAICKRIVERHGGQIWLESTPGEGSTFFFTLPKAA